MVFEQKFSLASGFLFTCGIFASIYNVFLNGFRNPVIDHTRCSFLFSR